MRRLDLSLPACSGVEVPVTSIEDLAHGISDGNLGVIGGLILDSEVARDTSTGAGTVD